MMTRPADDVAGIDGREAFIAALRAQLLALPTHGPRVLWCADEHFGDWPFDEAPVLDALLRWARSPGRLVHFIARDFEAVKRRHPRLVAWRRDWSHVVQAWSPADEDDAEVPGLLLAGPHGVELLDRVRWRGRPVRQAADLRALAERCEALAQRCEPAWPATTLGL